MPREARRPLTAHTTVAALSTPPSGARSSLGFLSSVASSTWRTWGTPRQVKQSQSSPGETSSPRPAAQTPLGAPILQLPSPVDTQWRELGRDQGPLTLTHAVPAYLASAFPSVTAGRGKSPHLPRQVPSGPLLGLWWVLPKDRPSNLPPGPGRTEPGLSCRECPGHCLPSC